MKIISAKMRGALVEAGASDETAEAAAADIGELAGEVRIIRRMLAPCSRWWSPDSACLVPQ